MKHCIL